MKFVKKQPRKPIKKMLNSFNRNQIKKHDLIKKNKTAFLVRGSIGLKLLENIKLKYEQLESIRRLFSKNINKNATVWYSANFSTPLIFKTFRARMGTGKGKLSHWVSLYKKGQIFLELDYYTTNNHTINLKKKFFLSLRHKLPFKFVIINKESYDNLA